MSTELEKIFDPKQIESKWSQFWEKQGCFAPSDHGNAYCIMLPPPNVTGTLHMGHGFQYTLMDALIRYHRMQGDNTLWQAGTDHAGIATQMVVERQLSQQNISRHDLGREAFLKKVWVWKQQSGETITQQIRRMGASLDWSRERFTMDDNISRATAEAFIRLYNEGLIYRGKKLVNWDPELKTAISDLEVSTETEKSHLWYMRYPVVNSKEFIIVATTRPETMLGDTAVAVHPDDERYKNLIGKKVALPLADREIPIIADDSVDPAFGTGCVKITPAHDFNDYATGQRHHLPMINVMTLDAKLNDDVPKKYRGLDRFIARKQIVADLDALGLLEKIEAHENNIPRGDRSGVIIEPLLTDQWFMKMDGMAKVAIESHHKNEIEFIPENWGKTYLQWLENIQDWCISRQLWWGHRIPVWYDNDGKHYVGLHEHDVRERHQIGNDVPLHQDNDVLDTWFSSALWPFATLGWPDYTPDLKTFYPTNVLVTGFDIIFFWVARMVMLGLKLTGKVPFKQVCITGLIRDSQGQKMSKSKGNILDPIDLIDGISLDALITKRTTGLMQPKMEKTVTAQTKKEFPDGISASGTDALRFTFCALATQGRNINFDFARLTGYRNFCNKIWNATRFVLMNISENINAGVSNTLPDRWILSQLQKTITQAQSYFAEYRFDQLAKLLYEFVWNDYCDWYLELAKCDLTPETKYTLLFVLENIMRLLHPIMPFITEEIWQKISPMLNIQGKTIMLQPYPTANAKQINVVAEKEIQLIKNIVTAIRNIRGEMQVSPAKRINMIFDKGSADDKLCVEKYAHYIKALAKIETITWANPTEKIPPSATALSDQLEIHIPLAGLIDKDAELIRLKKEIEKCEKAKAQMESRLNNSAFTEKAPTEVVTKLREEFDNTKQTLIKLHEQHSEIKKLI
ncbi:MAG TPA: valine--tRNA ligase [Coxiellaceae bacterium]|nr:MAG: valine--tRNA ligase [Gammaproteobacteria bacterium RIFCSPHIGHO2_12_FULL_36_30]HLB56751.1 valine--tRNA ligase [Coxiellaceae bacterium]